MTTRNGDMPAMPCNVPMYMALELDTGCIVEGFYYLENGYWMNCCKVDINRPVQRHYIVDSDGNHREIDEASLAELDKSGGES